MDQAEAAPVRLLRPQAQLAPLVFTSPHSGRCYAPGFLRASRLDARAIRRSEDSFVEEIFAAAPRLGAPLLAAQFPRAWCDVNREAWELDPGMFVDALPDYVNVSSPRVSAGLGTIARVVGAGEPIYPGKLRFGEAQARIATCWQPFHDALRRLIAETVARFGACLIVDCHSMPTSGRRPGPDVVLGDHYGSSCAPAMSALWQEAFGGLGLNVRHNDPYAGGYITRHYGRPEQGVHAIQIELARSLYMDEASLTRSAGFARLQDLVRRLLEIVLPQAARMLHAADLPAAAE